MLVCSHCEKPCGARITSSLDTTTCSEAATVTNSAGKLACKEPPPANADGLPEGTYLGSCNGCTLSSDGTLSCTACTDGAGKMHASSLALADCNLTSITNEQGSLSCEPEAPRQLSEEAAAAAETVKVSVQPDGTQTATGGHEEL